MTERTGADDVGEDLPVGEAVPALSPEEIDSQLVLLVQSLADVLPDDVVAFSRGAVVRGERREAATAVAFALLRSRTPATDAELAVLAECLGAVGESPDLVVELVGTATERLLAYDVVAFPEQRARQERGDDAEPPPEPGEQVAAADAAVLERVLTEGVLGVWRAWRLPSTGAAWPPPRPLYVVEVSSPAAQSGVLARSYGDPPLCLDPHGPLVEVYLSGTELPTLQRSVQLDGALVHQLDEETAFQFADVFEGEPGADGRPEHVVPVPADDADRMVAYLMSGSPLMVADTGADDVLDPARAGAVPLHLRTDGEWVWSDASAYYLAEHRVAPPAEFRRHLDERGVTAPAVPDVRRYQALAWLQAD